MSDRLQELLRQKALLTEHAAWLDREIALEQAWSAPAAPGSAIQPPAAQIEPRAAPTPAATPGSAPGIPVEYRSEPKKLGQDVTRGCLIYFVIALALVGIGFAAIFLFYKRG